MWSKTGIFFFSRHAQPPLGLWLCALQCEWINILLRTLSIWFLLDRNAPRFSVHLDESVVREIQKTKSSVIVLFLTSSCSESQNIFCLVYLCVQFAFSAAALHFLVRWISKIIALLSQGIYIPSLHFFCENNPEPWRVFFLSIGKWRPLFL